MTRKQSLTLVLVTALLIAALAFAFATASPTPHVDAAPGNHCTVSAYLPLVKKGSHAADGAVAAPVPAAPANVLPACTPPPAYP